MPLATTLSLPAFQGPLDLLLTLIERRRLEITDVSLAAVADQYLQAVRSLPEQDPDLLGEFLVIAARLLLLKSRALLPRPILEDEDEPLDDLAERLEEYRRFKEAAIELASRFEAGARAFPHPSRPEFREVQPELAPLEVETLAILWRAISHRRPAPAPAEEVTDPPRIKVDERLAWLRQRLAEQASLTWDEVAGQTLDEVIATFLAVLEMIRGSELQVHQERCFGPIMLLSPGR
jgi:segregation and condensation protein A